MYPRGTLDIGWKDLFFAWRSALRPSIPELLENQIAEYWSCGITDRTTGVLATLSVRTGFDALLQALDFPPGSEILVSAVTIPDMVRIIEAHGLVAVPVDLDMDTLSISLESLDKAISSQSRALVVAHIFGGRVPLDAVIKRGRAHDLLIIEDCAQCYARRSDRGDQSTDVSMFSFGPIKTNTALAGGILEFRDLELCELTRWVLDNYPRQDYRQFRRRVLKYMVIKALTYPRVLGVFARICRLFGKSYDSVIGGSLRSFAGSDFLARIRRRPSAPLLALLLRRITTYDDSRTDRRIARAEQVTKALGGLGRPGSLALNHSHWVYPVYTDDSAGLQSRLQSAGFDATRGASGMRAIEPPADRPELDPVTARRSMDRILYLPLSEHLNDRDIQLLAEICRTH